MIKPETQVELQIIAVASQFGIDLDKIDSKATYSKNKQMYTPSKSAPEGYPDFSGCDSAGTAVYIEVKAPGKLKTLRPKQRAFLLKKIESNCFAIVIDNGQSLADFYLKWLYLAREEKKIYLHSLLP